MVEMIWKEPPPAISSEKAEILTELQKHPGRWALVQARYKSTSATAPWKKLGCEAVYRRSETTETGSKSPDYDIYARWPEAKTAAPKVPAPTTVEKAITTGTALKPPAPPITKPEPAKPVVSDPGLDHYLENRRARVK